MRRIIVDSSVALAWLLEEERPAWVNDLMSDFEYGAARAIVPSLFWLEVGNILGRDHELTEEGAMDGLLRLEALGLETAEIAPPLRLRALQLARRTGLTMYDATYLAVAEATKAPLFTLDQRLERASVAMGLGREGGIGRISEPNASYDSRNADMTSLAAIGAALAEMRKQYSAT